MVDAGLVDTGVEVVELGHVGMGDASLGNAAPLAWISDLRAIMPAYRLAGSVQLTVT